MLKDIKNPAQLKDMSIRDLQALAEEIRTELVGAVAECGGHLASNLGVVELTIAMHRVFDCPEDKFVFDVGHQSYVHKLLTGRYEQFHSLRKEGGISGFPSAEESEYDCFVAGHASTAISAALGMARTRDIMHAENRIIAVVGDGALTGGMCYEALNDAGQSETPLIVILNDNEMSISRNVGALSRHLDRMRQSKGYKNLKSSVRRGLGKIPGVGQPIVRCFEKLKNSIKAFFIDDKFFEALGFTYIGPVDGHNLKQLIRVLKRAKDDKRPLLIHVVTQKGRGYQPAENHPDTFHGVAPFYVESGKSRKDESEVGCGSIVAQQLSEMAQSDIRLCVVSAAMPTGTGMTGFQEAHPERFFDVGIAEEHAVTMAAGMASAGMKPYVAIYSTFMQRAYDQILNDVCRCELPVTFLLDRAGFVGADGATHQGLFDLSYLRSMPNMIIAAPRDVRDLKKLVELSTAVNKPMAIRYPKAGMDLGPGIAAQEPLEIGKWELLSSGADVMFYAVGPMVQIAMQASIELMGKGIHAGVVDARFIKPMDEKLLLDTAKEAKLAVVLEENTLCGGLGEGIMRILSENGAKVRAIALGAPDRFVPHARISQQRKACGLSVEEISKKVIEALQDGGAV
ncbi:MAG: 1-deoxy-D-xylulose-5-phosphate synthase [Clostridia bacterium]|nr:1-deoxy-D-xylulose-5-phosphate synthase [Clostridia bacterium]